MTSKEVQISLCIVFLTARYVDNLHLASVPQGFFMGAKNIYLPGLGPKLYICKMC